VCVCVYTGIAFEQGHILPTPETVPFRLTRDIVDGMGVTGVEGVFRRLAFKLLFLWSVVAVVCCGVPQLNTGWDLVYAAVH